MAINTRKKLVKAAKDKDYPGATTHFKNDTTKPEEDSGSSVKNQQKWNDLLIDPDDEPGSTHFRNDQEYTDKSKGNQVKAGTAAANPAVKTKPTTAAAKKIDALLTQAAQRMTAGEFDMEEDEATGYTQDGVPSAGQDENATFPAGGENSGTNASTKKVKAKKVKASEDCEEGPQATTHFPNGEEAEPADGYLMVGELEDLDLDEEGDEFEDEDEEEVSADALEDDAGEAPQQSLLDVTEEHEVDAEFEDFGGEPQGEPKEVEDEAIDEAEVANMDEMSVLDVDGTDDEGDDAVFATVGTRLHVIKANRIIASMGKKNAVRAGHDDVYLSDQFQEVAFAEFSKHGLRAGLTKLGFAFARINVAKSDLVNKRVEAKAKQVTAAIRRTSVNSNEALGQCLAIAAVGINRQYFKDTRNELRASLEEELESAGVRGASRLVRRVFASKGIDYAKSILTLANKLVNMPEETRNSFASALDMTSDGEIEDDEEDMYGSDSNADFQAEAGDEFGGDGDDEEFVDEFEEEDAAPETVHAALSRPMSRRTEVSARSSGYSVTAQAILSGKEKLPFSPF